MKVYLCLEFLVISLNQRDFFKLLWQLFRAYASGFLYYMANTQQIKTYLY